MCTTAEMSNWIFQQTKKSKKYPVGAVVGFDTYTVPVSRIQTKTLVCGRDVYHPQCWKVGKTYIHSSKGNGYILGFYQKRYIGDSLKEEIVKILTPHGSEEMVPLDEITFASEILRKFKMEVVLFHGKCGEFDSPIWDNRVISFNGISPSEVQLFVPKGFRVESSREV